MTTIFPRTILERVRRRFAKLYGEEHVEQLVARLFMMIGRYGVEASTQTPGVAAKKRYHEKDIVLITYADSIRQQGQRPLVSLNSFLSKHLKGFLGAVHILPFYPWSSDDGFSVIDYRQVHPEYGSWRDIEAIGEDFTLMFDLVLNHCSSRSAWFKDFISGVAPARHFFHRVDPNEDLSQVVRPRALPLLTKTQTRDGEAWVWTTFSADQVDLDFSNPDVLFEFLDIIFLYLSHGGRILRLDAIAYLWKEIGTSCIHLPETHQVVKLIRDVLEVVAPDAWIITETNVPHAENISYFGKGDEAHLVYNFSLPPLLLYTLLRGDATTLSEWAATLEDTPKGCTYFNFTASHDGVGVRPIEGLLPTEERDWLVEQVKERNGLVSYKQNSDGSQSPYELNITYFSALSDEDEDLGVNRFLCSQAIALAFRGVPAVYIHSLTATPNYLEGVEASGRNRTINRRKWDRDELEALIHDSDTPNAKVFGHYLVLLRRRGLHPAFHPEGPQEVLSLGATFFGIVRTAPDDSEIILCLFNVTPENQKQPLKDLPEKFARAKSFRDLVSGQTLDMSQRKNLHFAPYQAMWLVLKEG